MLTGRCCVSVDRSVLCYCLYVGVVLVLIGRCCVSVDRSVLC